MEDAEIVELYWARDEDAVGQTKTKYGAYLNRVAYNILADLEDSQECVSDTGPCRTTGRRTCVHTLERSHGRSASTCTAEGTV